MQRHEGTKKLLIRSFSYLPAFLLSCFRAFVPSCSQNYTARSIIKMRLPRVISLFNIFPQNFVLYLHVQNVSASVIF